MAIAHNWKRQPRVRRMATVPSIAALVVAVVACGDRPQPITPPPPVPAVARVRVQVAQVQQYPITEEAIGTVRARLQARIEAKVAGRISEMLVVPGQNVGAGERLASLEVQEIRARLEQALAVREQAERDLRREATLLARGAATQSDLDAAQARARVARAAVDEAQTMLGYGDVVAPFAGVVTRKLADVGDFAAPGRALLELDDPTQLRLEADVPEAIIGSVLPGAKMAIRLPSLSRALEGTVAEIAPAADPDSRTFRVKLDLPPTDGLRMGQFGRVAVPVGETAGLRVPAAAVVRRGQLEMVFVLGDDRAWMRLVKTGKHFEREVEILSGLDAGDSVVMVGAGSLTDGQTVEVLHEHPTG